MDIQNLEPRNPEEQGARVINEVRPPGPTRIEFLRSRFVAGLITLIPALVTIWFVAFIVGKLDQYIGNRIEPATLWMLDALDWPQTFAHFITIGVSFVLTILFILAVGILTRFLFIRRMIHIGEGMVQRIPLIRFFYVTPKEVLRTLTTTKTTQKRVVLIEYPRKGIWGVAYATGEVIQQPGNRHMITVFLPTTPNPTSGFLLILSADEVYDINMTTEDAVRFIISGGILSPNNVHTAPFAGFDKRPDLPPAEPLTVDLPQKDQQPPA